MRDVRNYALEKLTTSVKYPCRYSTLGCEAISTSECLRQHESSCTFSNRCPLKGLVPCKDGTGLTSLDVLRHVRTEHQNIVFEGDSTYWSKVVFRRPVTYHAAIYDDRVFILRLGHSVQNGPVTFNILQSDSEALENRQSYKYKFEFIDKTGQGLQLVASRICSSQLIDGDDTGTENCLSMPLKLLEPFISDNKVHFRFQIQKS